jgi:hypothetical protein
LAVNVGIAAIIASGTAVPAKGQPRAILVPLLRA